MQDDFRAEGQKRWVAAIGQAFGAAPSSQEIAGLSQITNALSPFLGHGMNHAHFSSGGGMDILYGQPSVEPNCIDLIPSEKIAYLVQPSRLIFRYFDADPAESYLFLQLADQRPTNTYEAFQGDAEELVDLGGGQYVPRSVWDQGYVRHDYDGNEVPIPSQARIVIRILRGSILFVQHGSIWNGNSHTYDGKLQSRGEEAVFQAINNVISAR